MSSSGVRVRVRAPLARFDLDFELETEARSIGIFGPSGAGKTSALEAIAGWRAVREGRIELGGRTLLDTQRAIDVRRSERGIGYVPQDALLFPHWSVEKNIRCGERRAAGDGARELASDRRREFDRAIDVLELGPLFARRTTSLSGGERQRVALARALCSHPRFLLLDEPLGALDLPLRRRILPYLIRVRETFDVPMLFVSHDATEVQALCDEVAVVSSGRVVAVGKPSAILGRAMRGTRGFENVLRGTVLETSAGTARVEIAAGVDVIVPGSGLAAGRSALFSLGEDEILVSKAPIAGISARNILPARVETVSIDGDDALLETVLGESERTPLGGAAPTDATLSMDATPSSDRAPSPAARAAGAASRGARMRVRVTSASARDLELEPSARVHLVFKTQSCRVLSV